MTNQTATQNYFEYTINSGDTLSGILFKMFNITHNDPRYTQAVENLLAINPHINNVNFIRAGDILRLNEVLSFSAAQATTVPPNSNALGNKFQSSPIFSPDQVCKAPMQDMPPLVSMPVQVNDRENFWALSWLENNSNFLTIPGGITAGASTALLSKENIGLINEISDLYADFKLGKLTKGQYDYARKLKLDKVKKNFGPIETKLFGGKTTHQAVRIAKNGGVPANANIVKHAARLNTLSKVAKGGGIVLIGVGLTASCMQIANTNDIDKKNEIFVDTIASTTTGLVTGAVVGFFLVSNPIGWGTALLIAVGTTAVSYGSGKLAAQAYNTYGQKVDFVNGLGVSSVCR